MKRIPGFYHLETAIANAYYIQTGVPKGGWGPDERAIKTAMVLQQVAAGIMVGLQAIYDEVQKK